MIYSGKDVDHSVAAEAAKMGAATDLSKRMLDLVKHPDARLTKPCNEVKPDQFGSMLTEFVDRMFFTLEHMWGKPVGLAAPQVGSTLALFVTSEPCVYINPVIRLSQQTERGPEGCYSLPDGVYFQNWRAQSVWIDYTDLFGIRHENVKKNGLWARVMQHESDHLQGKVCATAEQLDFLKQLPEAVPASQEKAKESS